MKVSLLMSQGCVNSSVFDFETMALHFVESAAYFGLGGT
jgi:hypothetical protein